MKNNWYTFPLGAITTLIFFLIGYLTGRWEIAWLVFLLNPILYWFMHNQKKKNEEDKHDDLDF